MESMNLSQLKNNLKPNEKLLIEKTDSKTIYLCRCKGEYSPEYFYKQKIIIILSGYIVFDTGGDEEKEFKEGNYVKIEDTEQCRIKNSDALIITLIDEK
ncbi:MAG: hypothetical protein SVK54_00135 [candidate division WOR-3 bacterium]|nr:hypothetical protein [candidate division WOR-3 bacterium]